MKRLLLACAVAFVFVSHVFGFGFFAFIEGAVGSAGAGMTEFFYGMRLNAQELFLKPNTENPQEQSRLNQLLQENAQCALIKAENDTLRKMLAFKETSKIASVPARIIGTAFDPERSILLLNKGKQDGIRKGNAVTVDNGIFIGKIQSADERTSSLLLVNDNRSKVIATFINQKLSKGTVEGQFQLGLKMNLIPITEELKKGMTIVTSGTEGTIPAGLLIGTLGDIQSKATDLYQVATVEPAVSYDSLRVVSVLKTNDQE